MKDKRIDEYIENYIGDNFDYLNDLDMNKFELHVDFIVLKVIDKFDLRGYTETKNEITIIVLKEFINQKGK